MAYYVESESRLRNQVRQVRQAIGLSQAELARRTKLARYTVRRVERDDGYAPRMGVAVAICVALGRRLSAIWWIEPDPDTRDPGTPDMQAEIEEAGQSS